MCELSAAAVSIDCLLVLHASVTSVASVASVPGVLMEQSIDQGLIMVMPRYPGNQRALSMLQSIRLIPPTQ